MPRQPRPDYSDQFYHIFNIGFDQKNIFKNDADYLRFIEKLEESRSKFDWIIYSYCLMPNHYHLHVKRNNDSISTIIHWLQTSHSVYFNKNHKHFSPVFTGRFKSILIQKEIYHRQLSKYIHLNPVKAKVVQNPQEYSYSSYGEIIGEPKHNMKIIDGRTIRSFFGKQTEKAIQNYRNFVEEDKTVEYSPNLAKRGIAGSERFRSQFE